MSNRAQYGGRIIQGGVLYKAASALGRKGGSSKSEAKIKAARDNGKKGGRPRKPRE